MALLADRGAQRGIWVRMKKDQLRTLVNGLSAAQPVLIAGPTASGKSGLALAIAQAQGGVVINADALQVYGCWHLLTARPSATEMAQAPHRLYGHIGRDQPYSVGHWLREVQSVLAEGQRPIIVGGTGLYFAALTEGLAEIPDIPADVRARADALRQSDPAAMVTALDPATRARTDLHNLARVQRAWEVLHTTGRGLADWQADTPAPLLPRPDCAALVLRPDPGWLNTRIDLRFDQMMSAGALDEAQAELPQWQPLRPSARAIGAPELIAHLRGEITLAEATARAKLASRQYAKRQRTWLRNRMRDWTPIMLP